jgi:hypothetical protein
MKKLYALLILNLLFINAIFAQSTSVKGRVQNLTGQSLQSVNISVEKTNINTRSDDNGMYELKLPAGKYIFKVRHMGITVYPGYCSSYANRNQFYFKTY